MHRNVVFPDVGSGTQANYPRIALIRFYTQLLLTIQFKSRIAYNDISI